jgi:hypothetical protein
VDIVMKRFVAICTVGFLALAGCSNGSDGDDSASGGASALAVDQLKLALAAIGDAHPGETLEFTEINVQSKLVNAFLVQPAATELAYAWQGGALLPPGPASPQLAGATSFGLDDFDIDIPTKIMSRLATELPTATPVQLTLVETADVGLSWGACLISEKGGAIAVAFTLKGEIIGVVPDACVAPQ